MPALPWILSTAALVALACLLVRSTRQRRAERAAERVRRRLEPSIAAGPPAPSSQEPPRPAVPSQSSLPKEDREPKPSPAQARPLDPENLRELGRRETLFLEARRTSTDRVARRRAEGEVHALLRRDRDAARRGRSAGDRASAAIDASLGTFVVADCETTGLSAGSARLIEVSAIRSDIRGEVLESMSSLVRVPGRLPAKSTQLTGITDGMIERDGRDEPSVMREFLDFVAGAPVFFHNAPFDLGFLKAAAVRCGHPPGVIENLETHDTLAVSRSVFPGLDSYRLGSLATRFGLRARPTHRGLADAETTKELILLLRRASLSI